MSRKIAVVSCLNSVPEAARRLKVAPCTVRRLVRDGCLKSVRIGRRVMIPESVVEHVVEHGVQYGQATAVQP